MMTNCPNCGAPIESHKCAYCGTYIFDFVQMSNEKPFWGSFDINGRKVMLRLRLEEFSIEASTNDSYEIYADDEIIYHWIPSPGYKVHASFDVVPETKQSSGLIMMVKEDE